MDVETSNFFPKNSPRTTTFLRLWASFFGIIPSTIYSQDPNWREGGGWGLKSDFSKMLHPLNL